MGDKQQPANGILNEFEESLKQKYGLVEGRAGGGFAPNTREKDFETYLASKYSLRTMSAVVSLLAVYAVAVGATAWISAKAAINSGAAALATDDIQEMRTQAEKNTVAIGGLLSRIAKGQSQIISVNLRAHMGHDDPRFNEFHINGEGNGYEAIRTVTINPPLAEAPICFVALADVMVHPRQVKDALLTDAPRNIEVGVQVVSSSTSQVVVRFSTGMLDLGRFYRMDAALLIIPASGAAVSRYTDGTGDVKYDLTSADGKSIHTVTIRKLPEEPETKE